MFQHYENAATVPASVNDLILVSDACTQRDVNNGQTAARDTIMLVVSRVLTEDGVRKVMVKQVDHSLDGAVNSFMLDGMNCTYIPTTEGSPVENTPAAPTTQGEVRLADMIDNQSGIIIGPTGIVVLDYLYHGECPMARSTHRACEDGMLVCACQDCLGQFTNLRTDKLPYMPCPVCVGRDIASESRDFRETFIDSYCTDIGALMDMIGRINQRRAAMGYVEPARFNDMDWGIDMDLSRTYNDSAESEFEEDFDGDEPPLPSNPVSAATIETLRTILTEAMLGADGTAKCSICAEDPILGSEIVALPCGHWFDSTCIENWFATSNTCPNCRKVVMEVPFDVNRPELVKKMLLAEKNALEAMKNRLEAENNRLEALKNRLEAEKNRLAAEKIRLEALRNGLDTKENTLEVEVNALAVEMNALGVQVNTLDAEVNRFDLEVKRLEVEVNSLDVEVNRLDVEMNRLDSEVNRLNVEVNRLDTEMQQTLKQKEDQNDEEDEDADADAEANWEDHDEEEVDDEDEDMLDVNTAEEQNAYDAFDAEFELVRQNRE